MSKRGREQNRRRRAERAANPVAQTLGVWTIPPLDQRWTSVKGVCQSCGHRFLGNTILELDGPGKPPELVDICPRCRSHVRGSALFEVWMFGRRYLHQGLRPEEIALVRDTITKLNELAPNADAETIAQAVEDTSPRLKPVADYIRQHHLALAALGIDLLVAVVAFLTWIFPQTGPQGPAPIEPPGVTHQDMERLIKEFRDFVQDQIGRTGSR